MRIEVVKLFNMIGIREAEFNLNAPVQLICGQNEAGKSSICEGIRHALTGESTRVSLKKDYKFLINDAGTVGSTYLEYDGSKQACINLQNGTHELKEQLHFALPYVLNPALFASMKTLDRSKFLFELANLRSDGKEVRDKLLERNCDQGKVEAIMPFLRSSFDSAEQYAGEQAKEARANWKATTREAYGEIKAETWAAPTPQQVNPDDINTLKDQLTGIERELEEATKELGAYQAKINGSKAKQAEIMRLRDTADKLDRIKNKLSLDRKELATWAVKVNDAKFLAKSSGNIDCTCPNCNAELTFNGSELVERQSSTDAANATIKKLPEYEQTLAIFEKAVLNGERDLNNAEFAKSRLAELEAEGQEDVEGKIPAIQANISQLKTMRKQSQELLDKLSDSARQAQEAAEKTKKAMEYHRQAQAWDRISNYLSPNGIPKEMLSEALKPINDRLTESSTITGWNRVTILDDMSIVYRGKPYSLASESGKWRINAMIAEAISYLSGISMIMLDGFDVLSLEGRSQLFGWLEHLATNKEIETALIFGTLKAIPEGLPEFMEAHWIENGLIQERKAEAA